MGGFGSSGYGVGPVPGLGYLPTAVYPRIVWNGITLDLEGRVGTRSVADPPVGVRDVARPDRAAVRSDRVAQFTARREVIFGHLEDAVAFTVQHVPGWKARQIDQFLEGWGLPGKQFEFWLDRFQGAFLEFQDSISDQNGTAGTATGFGTISYEDGGLYGRALRLDPSEWVDFPCAPPGAQASLDRTKGLMILVVRPAWPGADGIEHTFVDANPAGNGRLRVYKSAGNNLVFEIEDSGGLAKSLSHSATWAAGMTLKIVVRWTEGGGLALWLNGAQTAGEPGSGTGTGKLPSLPTNFRVGANSAGGTGAPGRYDRLGFLTEGFWLTRSVVDVLIDEYFQFGSNYFAAAELVDVRQVPARPHLGRERYEYRFTIRKGVA